MPIANAPTPSSVVRTADSLFSQARRRFARGGPATVGAASWSSSIAQENAGSKKTNQRKSAEVRSQRSEVRGRTSETSALSVIRSRLRLRQQFVHQTEQLRRLDWLGEMNIEPGAHGAAAIIVFRVPGDGD